MNEMPKRTVSFSPPDISETEIEEVAEALRSGWITTGPRTKLLERRLAAYIETGDNPVDCTTAEAVEKYSPGADGGIYGGRGASGGVSKKVSP